MHTCVMWSIVQYISAPLQQEPVDHTLFLSVISTLMASMCVHLLLILQSLSSMNNVELAHDQAQVNNAY